VQFLFIQEPVFTALALGGAGFWGKVIGLRGDFTLCRIRIVVLFDVFFDYFHQGGELSGRNGVEFVVVHLFFRVLVLINVKSGSKAFLQNIHLNAQD